ncbi:hypothetical protein [Amycolatopsis sp. NPDC058986]
MAQQGRGDKRILRATDICGNGVDTVSEVDTLAESALRAGGAR